MIISQYKAIFVHIPKTAGTSVSKAIPTSKPTGFGYPGKHQVVQNYKKLNPQLFKEYFKFTFVRNPWDLAFSQYNYLWHGKANWPKKWRARKMRPVMQGRLLKWSFEEWIKSDLFLISSPASFWCKKCHHNQLDWLLNKGGKVEVDFVGRFENLQEDFNYVCDKMGAPQQRLPHINAGPKRKHYSEYYNNKTKGIVAKKYEKDIEYFNYEF